MEIIVCDECGSEYKKGSSEMAGLCPECAHRIYGLPRCPHEFERGRCVYCFWDGSESEYTKGLRL